MLKQPVRQGGFTIIELLTGITILSLLLAIGVPSFNDFVRTNRLAGQVNELMTAMNYARSEAYKRGMTVSVCAANPAGDNCAAAGAWTNGWLVITDATGGSGSGDGLIGAGDAILQRYPAPPGGFTYTTSGSWVGFKPMGMATGAGTAIPFQFQVYKSGCSGRERRTIDVVTSGRVSLTKGDCP